MELNATADGLTANAIPKGQEVLIVIGERLEKERIEVRLKGGRRIPRISLYLSINSLSSAQSRRIIGEKKR